MAEEADRLGVGRARMHAAWAPRSLLRGRGVRAIRREEETPTQRFTAFRSMRHGDARLTLFRSLPEICASQLDVVCQVFSSLKSFAVKGELEVFCSQRGTWTNTVMPGTDPAKNFSRLFLAPHTLIP